MSSEPAVVVEGVSKVYPIFKAPADRLKQMLVPRLQRAIGREPTLYFREFWALQDINFTVGRGKTVGIVGRNGSGKSTLLQIVCGTLSATTGSVRVSGNLNALLELGTGFNPEFTGRENVLLNGQLKGFSRQSMIERFDEIAAFADIGDFIDQQVKTYSSGMMVRLAFAVHAVLDPDVLIVDEALAVGDARFQVKCYDRLAELKERGTSILFVSHDVGAVRRFCDSAIWLEGGKVVEQGDAYTVSTAFTEFMLGGSKNAAPAAVRAPTTTTGSTGTELGEASSPASAAVSSPAREVPFAERFPYPTAELQPVRRWGSHPGLIVSVAITDADENRVTECETGGDLFVHVVADIPGEIERDGLSIGICVRRVDGIDVLIRCTYDEDDTRQLPVGSRVHAKFKVKNIFASADYRLAVAVEDRRGLLPTYYDFIEGALFFAVRSTKYRWGIVVPEVPMEVEVVTPK